MATKKSNTPPMDLFDAQIEINGLEALFKNIKVQNWHAEDCIGREGQEAFTTAIEAIADMGVRKCEEAARRIAEVHRP